MSKLVASCLYFTSFLPLWVSILFIDIKSHLENTENLWTERISIAIYTSFVCFRFYRVGSSSAISHLFCNIRFFVYSTQPLQFQYMVGNTKLQGVHLRT